ncbi:hypothetical protein [Microbacterium maritypicum]
MSKYTMVSARRWGHALREMATGFLTGTQVQSGPDDLEFEFPGGVTVNVAGILKSVRVGDGYQPHVVLTERWVRGAIELVQYDGDYLHDLSSIRRLGSSTVDDGFQRFAHPLRAEAFVSYDGKRHGLNRIMRAVDADEFFAELHTRRVKELAADLGVPLEYAEAVLGGAA